MVKLEAPNPIHPTIRADIEQRLATIELTLQHLGWEPPPNTTFKAQGQAVGSRRTFT
jgi:hypothetical protein